MVYHEIRLVNGKKQNYLISNQRKNKKWEKKSRYLGKGNMKKNEIERLKKEFEIDLKAEEGTINRKNIETIEELKRKLKDNIKINDLEFNKYTKTPEFVLSPTVCYHFYKANENSIIENDFVGATVTSNCYRNEGKSISGLRRLREFNMREIIFIGRKEIILKKRKDLLELQREMIERTDIEGYIQTASDPFFIDTYDKQRLFQISFDLKYEVKAFLPFESEWFAIGSVNYHQDHFGNSFNIRLKNNEIAHSCCLGYGLDRWCFSIFAQHGLNKKKWSKNLKELL